MQKRMSISIGALVITVLAFAGPAQAASLSTPNAKIRLAGGVWEGDTVINETGADQTIAARVAAGRSVRVELGVRNPLRSEMSVAVSGCGAPAGFRVRYETATGVNVTELVQSGMFMLGPIAAYGRAEGLFLVVTVRPNAEVGQTLQCPVTMASTDDFTARDTVKLSVTARRA